MFFIFYLSVKYSQFDIIDKIGYNIHVLNALLKLIFPIVGLGLYIYFGRVTDIILILIFIVFNPIKSVPIKESISDDIKSDIKDLKDKVMKIMMVGR